MRRLLSGGVSGRSRSLMAVLVVLMIFSLASASLTSERMAMELEVATGEGLKVAPVPSASACPKTAPTGASFECIEGKWTHRGSIKLEKTDLQIPSSAGVVVINGSLTFAGTAKLVLHGTQPSVNVTKCVYVEAKKAEVVIDMSGESSAPSRFTRYTPLISSTENTGQGTQNCKSNMDSLKLVLKAPKSCKWPKFSRIASLPLDLTYSVSISSVQCIIIYATIGAVAGLLALSTISSGICIYMIRRKPSDYAPLSTLSEETPIRRHRAH